MNLFTRAQRIAAPKNPETMEVIIKKGDGTIITVDNVKEFNITTTDGIQINLNQKINLSSKPELMESTQLKNICVSSEEYPNIIKSAQTINEVSGAAAKIGAGVITVGSVLHANSLHEDSEIRRVADQKADELPGFLDF